MRPLTGLLVSFLVISSSFIPIHGTSDSKSEETKKKNKFREREASDDLLGYPNLDEDSLLNSKYPRHLELIWQSEISSSIYATPLVANINRASDFPREYDGACLQMRVSYTPAAKIVLFLVQWTDCRFAGALGLMRILMYKVYVDGRTTMSIYERKASIKEFYAIIFPSLMQLHKGITDMED